MAAAEKRRFVRAMMKSMTDLARVSRECQEYFRVYFDRGYNDGAADPITDGDLNPETAEALDVSAADVAAGITLSENLPKFLAGLEAFASNYDTALSKLRNDI